MKSWKSLKMVVVPLYNTLCTNDTSSTQTVDYPTMPLNADILWKELQRLGIGNVINSVKDIRQTGAKDIEPPLRQLLQYPCNSLIIGRPLNGTMIVMAGQSGSGKSTTINNMFDDKTLCKTSSTTAVTQEVMEYRKLLKVEDSVFPLRAYISIVDVPGTLDVDNTKEAPNCARIRRFAQKHESLVNRSKISLPRIRKEVYPNIVLFTFNSADKRMIGKDANLSKCLKVLKQCDLYDKDKVNLIFVGTCCLSLATNEQKYRKKTKMIREHIQQTAFEILGIENVKVVFTENKPANFNLEKENGTDYYKLPDDELTPQNVFQAISDQLKSNEDKFGLLMIGYYFGKDIPEKTDEPEKRDEKMFIDKSHDVNAETNQCDIVEAEILLKDLNIPCEESVAKQFQFFSFGRGYDPIFESTKNSILKFKKTKQVLIHGTEKWSFPDFTQIGDTREVNVKSLTYDSKKEYENDRQSAYGIDLPFSVKIGSNGKWINMENNKATNKKLPFLYEHRIARIQMETLSNDKFVHELETDLSNLPKKFEGNEDQFTNFFEKWGSHYIKEIWVGGSIRVDCSMDTTSVISSEQIELRIKATFDNLSAGAAMDYLQDKNNIDFTCLQSSILNIKGGEPPGVTDLKHLTSKNFESWINSVKKHPVELEDSIKLWPYYKCITGPSSEALKMATLSYLEGKLCPFRKRHTREQDSTDVVKASTRPPSLDCFPLHASVATRTGWRKVSELRDNDEVVTVSKTSDGQTALVHTVFSTFLHIDAETTNEYLVLKLSNAKQLTISPSHLLYVISSGKMEAIQSRNVRIGDMVICIKNIDEFDNLAQVDTIITKIINIETTSICGMCAPMTEAGTLIVDGVFVSCYAEVQSQTIAHLSMAPLRVWIKGRRLVTKMLNSMFVLAMGNSYDEKCRNASTLSSCFTPGIHTYARFLIWIQEWALQLYQLYATTKTITQK